MKTHALFSAAQVTANLSLKSTKNMNPGCCAAKVNNK